MASEMILEGAPCDVCGVPFARTDPRPWGATCSAPCRTRRQALRHQAQMRATRDAAYALAPDPWDQPAPPYGAHLPGRVLEVRVAGAAPGFYSLAGATTVHGVLAVLTAHPHRPGPAHQAVWLDPDAARWWAHVPEAAAARLAGRTVAHPVGDRARPVWFGPALRLRAPPAPATGRHRLRVTAATAVVIRAGQGPLDGRGQRPAHVTRVDPDAGNLASALGQTLAKRLGLPELPAALIALEVRAAATRPWCGVLDRSGRLGGDGLRDEDADAARAWRLTTRLALAEHGTLDAAAKALGIHRRTLQGWLARTDVGAGLKLRGPGRPKVVVEYHVDYENRDGQHETVTGESLESIATQLAAAGYDGPHLRVTDAQGSTRGWAWVGEDDAPQWRAG
jgi:hypothetical protein